MYPKLLNFCKVIVSNMPTNVTPEYLKAQQKYEEARERAKSKMRDLIALAYESRGYVWEDDETPEIRALVDDIIDASVHKTLEILQKSLDWRDNANK